MINTEEEVEEYFKSELFKFKEIDLVQTKSKKKEKEYYDKSILIFDLGFFEAYCYKHTLFSFDVDYYSAIDEFVDKYNLNREKVNVILNMLNYHIAKEVDSKRNPFVNRILFNNIDKHLKKLISNFFRSLAISRNYNKKNGRFDTIASLKLEQEFSNKFILLINELDYIGYRLNENCIIVYSDIITSIINLFYEEEYNSIFEKLDLILSQYIIPFKNELEKIKVSSAKKIALNELKFNYISEDWFLGTDGVNQNIKSMVHSCYLLLIDYVKKESSEKILKKEIEEFLSKLTTSPDKEIMLSDSKIKKINNGEMLFPKQIIPNNESVIFKLKNIYEKQVELVP